MKQPYGKKLLISHSIVSLVKFRELLSSNLNEVIRAVFTKAFCKHEKSKTSHKPKPTNKASIKTFKRIKIVCFAFLCFLCARRKENREKRKVPTI